MDPLTLLLIAKTGIDLGSFFHQRRAAGKERDATDQRNAMSKLTAGLSPQVGAQQQPLPQPPGLGQAIDPLMRLLQGGLEKRQNPNNPDGSSVDKGAAAAASISERLGKGGGRFGLPPAAQNPSAMQRMQQLLAQMKGGQQQGLSPVSSRLQGFQQPGLLDALLAKLVR